MHPRTSWRKLLSFTPFLILLQALVPFVIILVNTGVHHLRWTEIAIGCIAYGVIAATAIKAFNEKYTRSLGLSSTEQLWALADTVRAGVLPEDKALRDALPAYLARRARTNTKSLGKNIVFYYCVFGCMFLLSVFALRDWPYAIFFGCFLVFGLYAKNGAEKSQAHIAALQAQLGLHSKKANEHAEEMARQWEQAASTNPDALRTGLIMGGVLLVGLLALAARDPATSRRDTIARTAHTFTSSKYDFRIDFPGTPASSDSTTPITSAVNMPPVPYARYSSSTKDKQEYFEVYAYNWSNQDADFADNTNADLKTFLKERLNQDISTVHGKMIKLIDKTDTLYANSGLSEVAEFSYAQSDGRTVYGFDQAFTVNNYQYDIVTINTDSSTFYWFAGTFKYTGPSNVLMWNQAPNLPSNYYNDGSCSDDIPGCTGAPNNSQVTGVNPQTSDPSGKQPTINISQ